MRNHFPTVDRYLQVDLLGQGACPGSFNVSQSCNFLNEIILPLELKNILFLPLRHIEIVTLGNYLQSGR